MAPAPMASGRLIPVPGLSFPENRVNYLGFLQLKILFILHRFAGYRFHSSFVFDSGYRILASNSNAFGPFYFTPVLAAIEDHISKARGGDKKKWKSPALFLSPDTVAHGNGRMNVRVINTVWNEACELAGAAGHTPHYARHAMGRHLIDKTGNIAAVQRQLGHTNPAHSMPYACITDRELGDVMDER